NPRASRTVPFVSKATGVPVAKAAARIMLGDTVPRLRGEGLLPAEGDGGSMPLDAPIAVKEVVLPFSRFADTDGRGVHTILGPAPVPRPGEALPRRGDGYRGGVRHRVGQVPGGRLRHPAGQGPGVRVGGQPGQAVHDLPGETARRPGVRDLGDARYR